jgi:hypothetical protein
MLWLTQLWDKKPNPVLSQGNISFLTGEQLCNGNFSKIIHFKTKPNYLKEQILLVRNLIEPKMLSTEALVFDLGPNLSCITRSPRKFHCGFCTSAKTKGLNVNCSCLTDIISTINLPQVKNPLDELFDDGSYFAHLPKDLRCLAIEKKQFCFAPSPEEIEPSDSLSKSLRQTLIATSLFSDETELFLLFGSHLYGEQKNIKLLSKGFFIFDIDDPFVAFLCSQAEKIMCQKTLRDITKRYLKFLSLFFLSNLYSSLLGNEFLVLLTVQEKVLTEMLDYKQYKTLDNRLGKITSIYNYDRI